MKQTINQNDFIEGFRQAGREDQFSYDGKIALFNYLEELEDSCDMIIEFDVIALCCDYTEYEDLEEYNNNYNNEAETMEEIEYYTQVININGTSFIIADY